MEVIIIPKNEKGRRETDAAVVINGSAVLVKEFSPFTLWTAACEALGLKDASGGFGYDSYRFTAKNPQTGEIVAEEIVGR